MKRTCELCGKMRRCFRYWWVNVAIHIMLCDACAERLGMREEDIELDPE